MGGGSQFRFGFAFAFITFRFGAFLAFIDFKFGFVFEEFAFFEVAEAFNGSFTIA